MPRAFLISDSQEAREAVASALELAGVERGDEPKLGQELTDQIRTNISNADFVAVALSSQPAPWAIFEIGIANGLGKPLLVLSPTGSDWPPFAGEFTRVSATGRSALSPGWQSCGSKVSSCSFRGKPTFEYAPMSAIANSRSAMP